MLDLLKVLIIVINVLLLVTLGYFVIQLKSETTACVTNPFIYGAKKANEIATSPLSCSCSFANGDFASFEYDAEKITPHITGDSRRFYANNNISIIMKGLNVS